MANKMGVSGLTYDQLYKAVAQAIIDNPQGGGGGGGFTAPSLIVTGTASYTVPVGYNARVTASCRQGGSLAINGTSVLVSHQTTWANMYGLRLPVSSTGSGTIGTSNYGYAMSDMSNQNTAYDSCGMSASYNVKTGTVITTSGNAVYCIELYVI